MDAVISGRAGVALLIEGEAWHSFDVATPDTLVPRNQYDWPYLFGEGSDLKYLTNTPIEVVQQELKLAYDCACALDMALIILDSDSAPELRKEAADCLNELLREPPVQNYLEAILYATPIPFAADVIGALQECFVCEVVRAGEFFQALRNRQDEIHDVSEAWNAVPSDLFGGPDQRKVFQSAAVHAGLFRRLVFVTAGLEDVDGFQLYAYSHPLIKTLTSYREILHRWLEPFRFSVIADDANSSIIENDGNFNESDERQSGKQVRQISGRKIIASAVGAIATVDRDLAHTMFTRLFTEGGKDCQITVVNSLAFSLESDPEFALQFGPRVIEFSLRRHLPGLLDNYLELLKEIPRSNSALLLSHLDLWFTEAITQQLNEKVTGELLAILRIATKADPDLSFRISQRIPIVSKGIAGGLAALYDNVSEHSEDPEVLGCVLHAVAKISIYNQIRIGNALIRTLPRLAQKIGRTPVIETVMSVYKTIDNEKGVEALIKAALKIPGWGPQEDAALLADENLSRTVRSILSNRVRR